MGRPVLWSVDEVRRFHLEVIARKLKLQSYADVMNVAIDEFIATHGTPVELQPEAPTDPRKRKK